MREFWVASGHHMTRRRADGWLAVTDELLLTYLARPEIVPPPEACVVERALHQRLLADPRAFVEEDTLAALADPDARENWEFMLAFRDLLVVNETIEGAYLAIVRQRMAVPPLFLNQLVHLVMRNALEGCEDPFVLRAAELFYRPQRASVRDGALLMADAELVETVEAEQAASPLTAMFAESGVGELDVMDETNAWTYWSRSDAHTMALNFGGNAHARTALATAIAVFVHHLLQVQVAVEPLIDVSEPQFRWFVGLDAEATAIGNALWRNEGVDPSAMQRLIGLFRLRFIDEQRAEEAARGHPTYLLMAMTRDKEIRLKPQNLVTGLPIAPVLN
ncbi:DUF6352 family protein [Pararhizobium haloflavum]|uniref:DUF6352 family protein n=1 Tax=Pararhizobium haloflavum TaxID=2037914 RepID=UPI000C17C9C3|nr:DUF6352 family protein [Pararhizobium haloflavum]